MRQNKYTTSHHNLATSIENFLFKTRYRWENIFEILRALTRDRLGMIGCIIVLTLIAIAIFAPWIAPYNPYELVSEDILLGPSRTYLLGTDHLGRDVLSRLIYGTRTALLVGGITPLIAMIGGLLLGITAAYFGGLVDNIIILFFDVLRSFPAIILILVLVSIIGPSIYTIILCMSVVIMTLHGRVARSRALSVKESEFVEAARGLGAGGFRVVCAHMIPHTISPLIVMMGMDVPIMIAMEAGLSFLGLGVQPPKASWGKMIRIGYDHIFDASLLFVWPTIMLGIAAVGFALFSEGLRKVIEPQTRTEELLI